MGIPSKLFGAPKPAARAATPTPAALTAQREALAERLMTPERAELIARAMEVQRSKQAVFKELADKVGQERMAEMIRRMMEKRD